MKKIITSFLLLAITASSFAQSIHILHENEDVTGKTIVIPIYKDEDFATEFSLLNTTSSKIDFQINRTILNPPLDPGSLVMFCSGTQCYTPSADITWTPKDAGSFIYANATLPSDPKSYGILAHYTVNETACKDLTVLYRVYRTTAGTKDTAYVTIKYSCTTGTAEENEKVATLSDAYPNPARDGFSVAYSRPDFFKNSLEVYDVFGRSIIREPLLASEGIIHINTSLLAPGIYFYTLSVNNQRSQAKRLIIVE